MGINHTKQRVAVALPKFRNFLQAGKTLYVEFVEGNLEEALKGKPLLKGFDNFDPLVEEAIKAGMRIISLDTRKLLNSRVDLNGKSFQDSKEIALRSVESGLGSGAARNIDLFYWMHELREKKWMLKLRQTREGDLVVVHSMHAQMMMDKFGIPKEKVLFFDKIDEKILAHKRAILSKENQTKFKELRRRLRELRKSRPR
ncbi:MAG: hypothetical protein Q7K42_01625 [Candidatus Diapherotrites archaeon]|nr:hypothetical protein [Candidatus Diapherotrites archaeon]